MRATSAAVALWWSSAASASTLAVAPFDVASADPAVQPLGLAMADMTLTDLCADAAVTCVERRRIDDLLAEMALGETGYLDPATAARMGKGLGAELVVVGSISTLGDDLRIDARVVDIATAKVVKTAKVRGAKAEAFDLEVELVASLAPAVRGAAPARDRVSVASMELFGQALAAEEAGKDGIARTLLDAAVKADPKMVWAADRLAELDRRLDAARAGRSDALSDELVALVGAIDAGDTAACAGFQARYWARIQPITMGGRAFVLPDEAALGMWQQAGLVAPVDDLDGLAVGVGRQLYEAHAVARLVLDKGWPDGLCPGANPNETVLGGMLIGLGFAREGADKPVQITMIAPDGSVARTPAELDDLLLEVADAYATRFPAGGYATMMSTWVVPAIQRVGAR